MVPMYGSSSPGKASRFRLSRSLCGMEGFQSLPDSADTITAISTGLGRSAIAVVRVSGSRAEAIGERMLTPWPLIPRVATLCDVRDSAQGTLIDRALVTFFRAPASFTGEDVLEFSTHGGYLVPSLVLLEAINQGARQSLPGEFTRRAVMHGRLDILQAEAVGDLIDARTQAMHHSAIAQLDGSLSKAILRLRDRVLELESLISYDIDFPEEDDGPIAVDRILGTARAASESIEELLRTAPIGEMLREGAIVVIAGRPNAGKSSLFNALLGESRAIVTDIPGTTRDALEALIEVHGWPVRLVDTAGIHSSPNVIERLGIEVSERYIEGADLILLCSGEPDDETLSPHLAALTSAPLLHVRTKSDLVALSTESGVDTVRVSALTRSGLDTLLSKVVEVLKQSYGTPMIDRPVITRARHRRALEQALAELQLFQTAWLSRSLPASIAAVHLRSATHVLEELVGTIEVDDVLDRLFSSFCVGK